MTDGKRLVRLHYKRRHHEESAEPTTPAAVVCELTGRRAAVVGFLREFRPDGKSTSDRDLARGLCVRSAGHIVDAAGGRVVGVAEWSIDGINLRILRDDVRQKCAGDQTLPAFMQTLGS